MWLRSSAEHMSLRRRFDLTLPTRTVVVLLSLFAMTQQPVSAAQPWPTSLDPTTDTRTFALWENGAPGALGDTDDDKPTLTVFPVRAGSAGPVPTTAVIIAPGGSYVRLSANHEGRQVANWFNSQGATAFVLRYRLGPRYHHPIEMGMHNGRSGSCERTRMNWEFVPIALGSWVSRRVGTSHPRLPRISMRVIRRRPTRSSGWAAAPISWCWHTR